MISVCEPYWERPKALRAQLQSFRELYGDRIEVVICDDGSPTMPARPVVDEFPDLNIVLIENAVKEADLDPCVPTNQAVEASTRDWIVLSQADIVHTQMVLPWMLKLFSEFPLGEKFVGYPACVNVQPEELQGGDVRSRWRCVPHTVLPAFDCVMMRRKRWLGMDEVYRDGYAYSDYDLWFQMMAEGFDFYCVPNLVVTHRGDLCEQWRPTNKDVRLERNLRALCEKFGVSGEKFVVQVAPADLPIVSARVLQVPAEWVPSDG